MTLPPTTTTLPSTIPTTTTLPPTIPTTTTTLPPTIPSTPTTLPPTVPTSPTTSPTLPPPPTTPTTVPASTTTTETTVPPPTTTTTAAPPPPPTTTSTTWPFIPCPPLCGSAQSVQQSAAAAGPLPVAQALPEANGLADIYVTDVAARTVTWVSARSAPCAPPCTPQDARQPAISADGATVAWSSSSADFVPDGRTGVEGVFLRDLVAPGAAVERVAVPVESGGGDGASAGGHPSLSRNGTLVALDSDAGSLAEPSTAVASDQNAARSRDGARTLLGATGPPGASTMTSTATTAARGLLVADSPAVASLSGVIRNVFLRQRRAAPSLSPPAKDFGMQEVGTLGPPQTFTLANGGAGPLEVGRPTIEGAHPTDFSVLADGGTCAGATLHRGQSCTVDVVFAPTVGGARAASLVVPYEGAGPAARAVAPLGGTGTALLSQQPDPADFGAIATGSSSAPVTITLTNQGTVPHSVGPLTVTGAGPGEFVVVGNSCAQGPLEPGRSCTITVVFTPAAVGDRTATMSGTFAGLPFSVALKGTGTPAGAGISVGPVDFGPLSVGAPAVEKDATVTNGGAGSVTIVGVTLGSGAPDFAVATDGCAGHLLAPKESCTVKVSFQPSATGAREGRLKVQSNGAAVEGVLKGEGKGPAVTVTPDPVDFGPAEVGEAAPEQIVTVKIEGVALRPNAFTVGGPDAPDFTISSRECTAALPAGTSCQVTLGFTPAAAGARKATLSGSFGAGNLKFSVGLEGSGGKPAPVLAPDPLDFGPLTLATSAEKTVTVTNQGDGIAKLGPAAVAGANAADFSIVSDECAGRKLAKDAGCAIQIRFSPASTGLAPARSRCPRAAP